MAIVTKTQLENAAIDAVSIEEFVNGPADLNGTGIVTTRTGATYKTINKIVNDIEVAEQEAEQFATAAGQSAQTATEQAGIATQKATDILNTYGDMSAIQDAVDTTTTNADEANQSYQNTLAIYGDINAVQVAVSESASNASLTEADRIQTGFDREATSADRVDAANSAANASAIVTGAATGYPNIKPSLLLNFAATKSLDPRITFSRASKASYFDEEGLLKYADVDEPVFDHDPVTGESKGLAIWEQRTNLLTYSDPNASVPTGFTVGYQSGEYSHQLIPASWLFSETHNAVKHIQLTSGRSPLTFVTNIVAGVSYSFSVYFDLANSFVSSGSEQILSLSGSVTFTDGSLSSGSLLSDADSRGKITRKFTANSSGTLTIRMGLGVFNSAVGQAVFTAWQLEAGSFPTPYIPTTDAQATRAADIATMTGSNFSDWYRQNEGSFLCSFFSSGDINSIRVFTVDDGTLDNRIGVISNSGGTGPYCTISTIGVSQATLTDGALSANTFNSSAISYMNNMVGFSRDGRAAVKDTSAVIPEVATLRLGADSAYGFILNGHIANLAYYPKAISDSELQIITQQ